MNANEENQMNLFKKSNPASYLPLSPGIKIIAGGGRIFSYQPFALFLPEVNLHLLLSRPFCREHKTPFPRQ